MSYSNVIDMKYLEGIYHVLIDRNEEAARILLISDQAGIINPTLGQDESSVNHKKQIFTLRTNLDGSRKY